MAALELDIKMTKSAKGIHFTIQIVEQRFRGSKANFVASNGFYFSSLSCPAIGTGYNHDDHSTGSGMMYLRGSGRRTDNDIMHTNSVGYVGQLKVTVKEYNIAMEDVT